MKLRRNDAMNSVPFIDRSSAVAVSTYEKNAGYVWVFSGLKIHTTQEGTENSDHPQRCGNCLTGRSLNKTGNAKSATKNSRTTTTSCQTTGIPKEWEEHGETIIQTIFKQHTGGAMEKRDQPEWMTDAL